MLYRDEHLLIVDKPTLLLSVPGRHPLNYDCLLNRLDRQYPGVNAVHRLDLDTSGVMVVPRNKAALSELARQFQARRIHKTYFARVAGRLLPDTGEITLPLTRDWPNRPRQKVCFSSGKSALTRWRVVSQGRQHDSRRTFPRYGSIASTAYSFERNWTSDFRLRFLRTRRHTQCLTASVAPRDQHCVLSSDSRPKAHGPLATQMHLRQGVRGQF